MAKDVLDPPTHRDSTADCKAGTESPTRSDHIRDIPAAGLTEDEYSEDPVLAATIAGPLRNMHLQSPHGSRILSRPKLEDGDSQVGAFTFTRPKFPHFDFRRRTAQVTPGHPMAMTHSGHNDKHAALKPFQSRSGGTTLRAGDNVTESGTVVWSNDSQDTFTRSKTRPSHSIQISDSGMSQPLDLMAPQSLASSRVQEYNETGARTAKYPVLRQAPISHDEHVPDPSQLSIAQPDSLPAKALLWNGVSDVNLPDLGDSVPSEIQDGNDTGISRIEAVVDLPGTLHEGSLHRTAVSQHCSGSTKSEVQTTLQTREGDFSLAIFDKLPQVAAIEAGGSRSVTSAGELPGDNPWFAQRSQHATDPSSGVDDCVEDIKRKLKRKIQAPLNRARAELQANRDELHQASATGNALRNQVQAMQQRIVDLTSDKTKLQAKNVMTQNKVNKLKIFMDGLGKDWVHLKKEVTQDRHLDEERREEASVLKRELDRIRQDMNDCCQNAQQIKQDALRTCHALELELRATRAEVEALQRKCEEQGQLLVHEQDQRNDLAIYIEQFSEIRKSLHESMHSVRDHLLEEILAIQITVKDNKKNDRTLDVLEHINSTLRSSTLDQADLSQLAFSAKDSLASINEHVLALSDENAQIETTKVSIKASLDAHFDGLQVTLSRMTTTMEEQSENQAVITGLQQQTEARQSCLLECQANLETARISESRLREQCSSLQAMVASQQDKISSEHAELAQLSSLHKEVQVKSSELDLAQNSLRTNLEQLQTMVELNGQMKDEIDRLKGQVTDQADANQGFASERQNIELQHEEDLNKVREQARNFHAQEESKAANEIKRLSNECENLQQEMGLLVQRLKSAQSAHISDEKQNAARDPAEAGGAYQKLDQRDAKQVQDLELSLEHASRCLLEMRDRHAKAMYRIDELEQTAKKNQIKEAMQKLEAEQTLSRKLSPIVTLQQELSKAQSTASLAERRLAAMQISCDAAVQAGSQKAKNQVNALQVRLAETEQELQDRVKESDAFRARIEESWRAEEGAFSVKIRRADVEKEEAVAKQIRLLHELQTAKAQLLDINRGSDHAIASEAKINLPQAEVLRPNIPNSAESAARTHLEMQKQSSSRDQSFSVQGGQLEQEHHAEVDLEVFNPASLHSEPISSDNGLAPFAIFEAEHRYQVPQSELFGESRIAAGADTDPVECQDESNMLASGGQPHEPLLRTNSRSEGSQLQDFDALFKRQVPLSNSSSKLRHQSSELSMIPNRQHSRRASRKKSTPAFKIRSKTPEMRAVISSHAAGSVSPSSSPNFISDILQGRNTTCYNDPRAANAGRAKSNDQSEVNLHSQAKLGQKRKPDSHVIQGYEVARKKRTVPNTDATGKQSLRLRTSGNDVAMSQDARKHRQEDSSSVTKVQSGARDSSQSRRSTNIKKNDKINARFSRELRGR